MLSVFGFTEVMYKPIDVDCIPEQTEKAATVKIIEVANFQYAKFQYATYKFGDLWIAKSYC